MEEVSAGESITVDTRAKNGRAVDGRAEEGILGDGYSGGR